LQTPHHQQKAPSYAGLGLFSCPVSNASTLLARFENPLAWALWLMLIRKKRLFQLIFLFTGYIL
jgi:hypothetical protein